MKPLAIWVVAVAVVLGGYAVVSSMLRETSRVVVVVDSSFPMTTVWSQVPGELDEIDGRDHAEFALATEKRAVHSWRPELTLTGIEPFAPCTFETIESHPEVAEADELILITTPGSCDTGMLTEDWRVVELSP
jgi:hypothetical protein